MYLIIAIIRTHLVEKVRDALHDADILGFTVTDCRGEGRQRTPTHTFRGSQYGHGFEPRARIEIAVNQAHLNDTLDAIEKSANTGEIGDGKIFVVELKEVIRIRTGERGETALS